MLTRIGHAHQDEIVAYLQQNHQQNILVLSDLMRWSKRHSQTMLDLIGYRYENHVIAASAVYRDGRWFPYFSVPFDSLVIPAMLADLARDRLRWIMGVRYVVDPILEAIQSQTACSWDHDERGLLCYVDASLWKPYPAPGIYRAVASDLDGIARLRCAFEQEYFGTPPERVHRHWYNDMAQYYIDQGTYVAKREDKIISMVAVEAVIPQVTQLGAVYTLEDYRDQGWAKAVVSAACEHQLQHTPRVILNVRSDNLPARKAYQSLGFTIFDDYRMTRLRL